MPSFESHRRRSNELLSLGSQPNSHRRAEAREVLRENRQKNPHRSHLPLFRRVCMHHGVALHVGGGANALG